MKFILKGPSVLQRICCIILAPKRQALLQVSECILQSNVLLCKCFTKQNKGPWLTGTAPSSLDVAALSPPP